MLFLITPFIAISNGLTNPNITATISNKAARDSQGEIMGINQSIAALAQMIPPIAAGIVLSINLSLPILMASFFIFCAWMVFMNYSLTSKNKVEPAFDLEDYTKPSATN
jgi:MFS transporter, DHA1 family, tetracycline resistance protein